MHIVFIICIAAVDCSSDGWPAHARKYLLLAHAPTASGSYRWGLWQVIAWTFLFISNMLLNVFYNALFFFFSCTLCLNLSAFIPIHFWFYFIFVSGNLCASHPRDHYWADSITFYACKSWYLCNVCSSSLIAFLNYSCW